MVKNNIKKKIKSDQKNIYDNVKIDLPLNGVNLFWSDEKNNPKSEYIKNRNKKI